MASSICEQRQRVAVFVRRDDFDRFMSCLVFVPRDRYTTQLRLAIQAILERAFAGEVAAHYLQVGDAPLARLHIVVQTTARRRSPPSKSGSWRPRSSPPPAPGRTGCSTRCNTAHGEEEGRRLHRRYGNGFPLGYRERFNAEQAVSDIAAIERTLAERRLSRWRSTGRSPRPEMHFRLKVYQPDQPIVLSHVLPILEHLGLRVVDEVPHSVRVGRQQPAHGDDPRLRAGDPDRQAASSSAHIGERFEEAFTAVWHGQVESDKLNALVLSADLTVRQVTVLRAYEKYLRQAGIPFTQAYLEQVLTAHPAITGAILRLFLALFDPDADADDPESRAAPLRAEIAAALDEVASADDDRILRRFLNLVEATLRTNYFQTGRTARPSPTSRSSSTAARSRICRCRGRWWRSSSTAGGSRASTCAAARWRAAASAGPTAARTSAPRSSG